MGNVFMKKTEDVFFTAKIFVKKSFLKKMWIFLLLIFMERLLVKKWQ